MQKSQSLVKGTPTEILQLENNVNERSYGPYTWHGIIKFVG